MKPQKPESQFRGRTYKQFLFVYWFAIAVLIGSGTYFEFVGGWVKGTVYGKFGGSREMYYDGGTEYLSIAGILLLGGFLIWWFSPNEPGLSKDVKKTKIRTRRKAQADKTDLTQQ